MAPRVLRSAAFASRARAPMTRTTSSLIRTGASSAGSGCWRRGSSATTRARGTRSDMWVAEHPGAARQFAWACRPPPDRHERDPRRRLWRTVDRRPARLLVRAGLGRHGRRLRDAGRPTEHLGYGAAQPRARSSSATFNVQDFDPEAWKNEYPIAAFSRMTERDGAWMARILARFTPKWSASLARSGRLSDAKKTAYLEACSMGGCEEILERYLTRLSPITDVHVESSSRFCGVNLAEWRGLRAPDAVPVHRALHGGSGLPVERRRGGKRLREPSPRCGGRRLRWTTLRSGTCVSGSTTAWQLARWSCILRSGPTRGYVLAGVERTGS